MRPKLYCINSNAELAEVFVGKSKTERITYCACEICREILSKTKNSTCIVFKKQLEKITISHCSGSTIKSIEYANNHIIFRYYNGAQKTKFKMFFNSKRLKKYKNVSDLYALLSNKLLTTDLPSIITSLEEE